MGYFFIHSLEYTDKVGYTKCNIEYAFAECPGEGSKGLLSQIITGDL